MPPEAGPEPPEASIIPRWAIARSDYVSVSARLSKSEANEPSPLRTPKQLRVVIGHIGRAISEHDRV